MSDAKIRAYSGRRDDVASLIDVDAMRILDVGCGGGGLAQSLGPNRGVRIVGIEPNPDLAAEAAHSMERVIVDDAEMALQRLHSDNQLFDVIVFADTLEHLIDPWSVYLAAQKALRLGGQIVVSIPNVAHWDTWWNLAWGRWPRRDRGIHDDTHLRFFAKKDVIALLGLGGTRPERLRRVYRLIERPHKLNRYAATIGWMCPSLFTYQFLATARLVAAPPSE